jgi:glycosyltransferase involved in cell wall biosynthesis
MTLIDSEANLISVVIPTKNRGQRLIKAIDSAQNQYGINLEILVVDDASLDNTEAIVRALEKNDPRIRYFRHSKSLGGGAARNTGIKNAKGSLVAFLDDDDEWREDKLLIQTNLLKSDLTAVAAASSFTLMRPDGTSKPIYVTSSKNRQNLLKSNHLGGASVCLALRNALLEIGGFDSKLLSCQDWDLWLKLDTLGEILTTNELLVLYNDHQDIRITGNLYNEYQGRKKLHLRYRKEMSMLIRKDSLMVIIFYKKILLNQSPSKSLKNLFLLVLKNRNYESVKLIYRYIKYRLNQRVID